MLRPEFSQGAHSQNLHITIRLHRSADLSGTCLVAPTCRRRFIHWTEAKRRLMLTESRVAVSRATAAARAMGAPASNSLIFCTWGAKRRLKLTVGVDVAGIWSARDCIPASQPE
jgi:hypothetical protein